MQFQAHRLDGAMLYFHRASGTSVRVGNARTAHVRRTAPRVVMFGVTNACNLRCSFCSRDVERRSEWTVASAAEMLEGLAAAGTLEVAFGGGEPYAFRGLGALVARLRTTTNLALHVTTNGTLLDPAIDFDMVRLSIYDETWRSAKLPRRWGANVIVDDAILERLPALLLDLARAGAHDVSLLSYVGPDDARHLSPANEAILAAVIAASPIPCRVSVCWGDRVARLFGGDCGAGLDFVTLTSDRRLQSCSFQDVSVPVECAADVLAEWRKRAMGAPSSRRGCARVARPTPLHGIRIYQGFSGNNSGECVLVARFDEVEDATKLLADVIPGFAPGDRYSEPWKELFTREDVVGPNMSASYAPDEIVTIGKTFLARTNTALADDFPELRALAWKRGAFVMAGGVHVHASLHAVFVVHCPGAEAAVLARCTPEDAIAVRHGEHVVGAFASMQLADTKASIETIAGAYPFVTELYKPSGDTARPPTVAELGHALARNMPADTSRLAISFRNDDGSAFASFANATAHRGVILVENLARPKRLAVQALRRGGAVAKLAGEELLVYATFSPPPQPRTRGTKAPAVPPIDPARLARELDVRGIHRPEIEPSPMGGRFLVRVQTKTPATVLGTLDALGKTEGHDVWLGVSEVDPLGQTIRRLMSAVR